MITILGQWTHGQGVLQVVESSVGLLLYPLGFFSPLGGLPAVFLE